MGLATFLRLADRGEVVIRSLPGAPLTRAVLVFSSALVGLLAAPRLSSAQSVQPCPNAMSCAQVSIGGGSGAQGDTVPVTLSLQKGPNDGQMGGIDELAAIALTLRLGDDSGTPLQLADCTLGVNGLPAPLQPSPSIAAFNVFVENLACATGRTHCLCPNPVSGITPDNFINLAIFGPNPLPIPGIGMVDIPLLPDGQLLTINLKIGAAATGTIALHVFTQWTDADHPTSTAFLSVADEFKVDQTCVPVAGMPPCSSGQSVSQVVTVDGSINVTGAPAATLTPTATVTRTATVTPTATVTRTSTVTPTATVTHTATRTATPSRTGTVTATANPSASATRTSTSTPTATATPTFSVTPTLTATTTVTSTATVTATATRTNTSTPTPTATVSATPTDTPTATATDTPTATATDTPTETPTPSVTAGQAQTPTPIACVGDCNNSNGVTVDEILTMVSISLGNADLSTCLAGDANNDQQITIDEILAAVQNALNGCPGTA